MIMIALLLWLALTSAIYLTLRPLLGRFWTALIAMAMVAMASVAASTERLRFGAIATEARDNPISLLMLAGMLASIALTLHALIHRSWLEMWLAALGSLPLLLSQIGYALFVVTCLQLAAAMALRRSASAAGWALAALGGLFFWGYWLPLSQALSLLIPGNVTVSLLIVAVLLPVLPIGVPRTRPA